MDSVNKYYHHQERNALDAWNGGEGQRTGTCRGKVGVHAAVMPALTSAELASHTLVKNIVRAGEPWMWGGEGPIRFLESGALQSPWGEEATWGTVPSPWRKDSLHIKLRGKTYLLMFLSEKWSFVAVRCEEYARSMAKPSPGEDARRWLRL